MKTPFPATSIALLAAVPTARARPGNFPNILAALDEEGFENAFQTTDLLADRRLGHAVDLGGFREAAALRQVTKHLEALDLHKQWEYAICS